MMGIRRDAYICIRDGCFLMWSRTEDIVAEDVSRRAYLFCEPGKPLDQTPFLRVISAGDAVVQQIASVSLALLIVVRAVQTLQP